MIGVIITTLECNLSCRYCYEHSEPYRARMPRVAVNNAFTDNFAACEEYISCLSELARKMAGQYRLYCTVGNRY